MVVWRGRGLRCTGGGVSADGSNMIYTERIKKRRVTKTEIFR